MEGGESRDSLKVVLNGDVVGQRGGGEKSYFLSPAIACHGIGRECTY